MAMLDSVVGSGVATAMLWQARAAALVLPDRFTRDAPFAAAAEASAARGWPVVARKTGGGITPQGPGVINLALCFQGAPGQSRSILSSYAKIVDPRRAAFATRGIAAEATPVEGSCCDGDYNLAVDGRKSVGTAQRWRGTSCLIHALVLTDIDLEPAVEAIAAFSADLTHDTVFKPDVHSRIADLVASGMDPTQATVDALGYAVAEAGYAPFAP